MTKNKLITEAEFDELCRLVFFQLTPSDSEECDRETLTYAIYWQLCYLFEQPLDFGRKTESRTPTFRKNIQTVLNDRLSDSFDVLQIIDRNIAEQIIYKYKQNSILKETNLHKYFKIGNLCY